MLSVAFHNVFQPSVIMLMLIGTAAGICIGALPGLTATMGVALLLPLTFGMDATQGILMLCGIYCGAIYGGSISAILLHTPGTPSAAATAIDGYQMALKGEAGRALGLATMSSYIGGLVSVLCLWLISPQLAKLALKFSSAEFFLLAMFGLCVIGNISGKSISKGIICGCVGVLVSSIGIDTVTGFPRFAAGVNTMGGINYIPVLIGLFAMSQAFENIEDISEESKNNTEVRRLLPTKEDMRMMSRISTINGLIGTIIGIIPGAGGDIGAFLGYNTARAMTKDKSKFGFGAPEGVAGPEAGNNGVTGGAMIPMLTLGVPGDSVTAIMIGALTIQGLSPGPMLFQNHKDLVYTIFLGMFVANTMMVILGFSGMRAFTKILSLPNYILTPLIFVLCIVGSYAMNNSIFDIYVMLLSGIVGYFFIKVKVPSSPMVLGLILGPMAEKNFRTALLKTGGDFSIFFSTPICWIFICLILVSFFGNFLVSLFAKLKGEG